MPTDEDYARMEREVRDAATEDVLAVDRCLTDDERALFLSRVVTRMPRLDGAHVADILDIWQNCDAFLGLVEPFWGAHEAELWHTRGAVYAVYAALVLDDGSLKIETVRDLVQRAGLPPREA
jgi:hypothetical protein